MKISINEYKFEYIFINRYDNIIYQNFIFLILLEIGFDFYDVEYAMDVK